MGKFVNRVSQFPNRSRLKIVSQDEDEMVVDIVKDNVGLVSEGTKLDARVFNDWDDTVMAASDAANEAKQNSNDALSIANNAQQIATTANENVNEALRIANEAKTAVEGVDNVVNAVSKTELFDLIYPKGSIYLTTENVNPGTLFGGTWERWGKGRAIVGEDSSDSDFTPVEYKSGSKNFQKHSHCVTINETTGLNGTLAFKTYSSATAGEGDIFVQTWSDSGVTPSGTSKDKNVKIAVDVNHNHTGTIDEHGLGTCGNLQPYIVCYTWKRKA